MWNLHFWAFPGIWTKFRQWFILMDILVNLHGVQQEVTSGTAERWQWKKALILLEQWNTWALPTSVEFLSNGTKDSESSTLHHFLETWKSEIYVTHAFHPEHDQHSAETIMGCNT